MQEENGDIENIVTGSELDYASLKVFLFEVE